MDSVLKQTKRSAPAATGRRKRSTIPVPVTVSGVDKHGQIFREDSRTLVITRHGMMVETIHRLNLGTEITVENPALGRKSTGRVVWCGTEQSASQVHEIGIYLTDAEGMCGIELAPEETELAPATNPDHGLQKPLPSASAQPGASGDQSSEPAAALRDLPAEPLHPKHAEGVKPLGHKADEAHVQELDLTSGLGQVESVSRSLNSPVFPALDVLPTPSRELAGPTEDTFGLSTIKPAGAPSETLLPAEQVNSAVEASLSLFERRIDEIVPVEFGQFEEKLKLLAQESVSLVQGRLQESVAGVETKIADLVERETASLGDRLRGAHDRLEEQWQRGEAGLRESVSRLEGDSAARLEQRMTEALDQQLASVADRLKRSSAEVEGLLARLEEQRQRAEAGLQESASRMEGESAARLEQRMTEALDHQLASVVDRLQGPRSEPEGWLGRLEETRQQACRSVEEAAAAREADAEPRLEQKITASLHQLHASLLESATRLEQRTAESFEQQLVAAKKCLEVARVEAESSAARLAELQQKAQAFLQEALISLEKESAFRLESRMAALVETQMASFDERLQGPRAEMEAILARVEESRRRTEANLKEFATRLEEKTTEFLEQHATEVENRLQSCRTEVEYMLAGFEETRRQVRQDLQESTAQLEQRVNAFLDQKLVTVENRIAGMRADTEILLIKLQQLYEASENEIAKTRVAVHELGGQTVQFALEGINEKLETDGARTLAQFRSRSAEVVESEYDALTQRVSSASFAERLQSDADVVLSEVLERLQQTTALLEKHNRCGGADKSPERHAGVGRDHCRGLASTRPGESRLSVEAAC